MPQIKIKQNVDTLVIRTNTLSGITYCMITATKITSAENTTAFIGTLLERRRNMRRGALPSRAKVYTMRLVLKIPLLHADAADVSTIKFTIAAAATMPAAVKICTNGLESGLTEVQG